MIRTIIAQELAAGAHHRRKAQELLRRLQGPPTEHNTGIRILIQSHIVAAKGHVLLARAMRRASSIHLSGIVRAAVFTLNN